MPSHVSSTSSVLDSNIQHLEEINFLSKLNAAALLFLFLFHMHGSYKQI